MVPSGCGFFVQGPNELFTWDTAQVLGDATHPDADRVVFFISRPNHQCPRNAIFGGQTDSVLYPIGGVVEMGPKSQSPQVGLNPSGVVGALVADRQNPDLFRGQPRGEGARSARSTPRRIVPWTKRRAVNHHRLVGFVVSTDVRKIDRSGRL